MSSPDVTESENRYNRVLSDGNSVVTMPGKHGGWLKVGGSHVRTGRPRSEVLALVRDKAVSDAAPVLAELARDKKQPGAVRVEAASRLLAMALDRPKGQVNANNTQVNVGFKLQKPGDPVVPGEIEI